MKRKILLLLCAAAAAGCAGNIRNDSVDDALNKDPYKFLAKRLSEAHDRMANRKVAVLPFSYTDNRRSDDGVVVAERLLTRIIEENKLEVVERNLLEKVMGELKLQHSGVVDETSIKQLGKVLGVEAVVTGTLTSHKDGRVEINARLIRTETASVLSAASGTVVPDWDSRPGYTPQQRPAAASGMAVPDRYPRPSRQALYSERPLPEAGNPPRDGLVAYWKFDEGSGSSASDSSGNGNTAALNGPLWTAEGRKGRALSFNGIEDYVRAPSNDSLNAPAASGKVTLAGWYYIRDLAPLQGDCANSPAKYEGNVPMGYGLFICNSPWMKIRFHLGDGVIDYNVPHELHTWIHYAATYDGKAARIFKNGKEVLYKAGPFRILSSPASVLMGKHGVSGHRFNGLVDEVVIYDRALSHAEISALYGSHKAGPASAAVLPRQEGPVAYWRFDEGSGSAAADSSRNNNTGTLLGPVWTKDGKIGGALNFDGQRTTKVLIADSPALNAEWSGLTLAAWIKLSRESVGGVIIKKGYQDDSAAQPAQYSIHCRGGAGQQCGFQVLDAGNNLFHYGGPREGGSLVGQWFHVVGTYDKKMMRTYYNGQEAGTGMPASGLNVRNSNVELQIGGALINGQYDGFAGIIDDVRIYNRALSADEVAELFDSGKKMKPAVPAGPR